MTKAKAEWTWTKERKAQIDRARREGWKFRWKCGSKTCGQVNPNSAETCWNCVMPYGMTEA